MKFAPALLVSLLFCAAVSCAADYKYIRRGNAQDVQTHAEAGVAMMGGGSDLDEAFRWLCGKANGGDFLILRAHGSADYNPYVNGLCKANSVATLIIPSRKAAQAPRVAEIIGQAEAIFIAGGDQSRYVNFWKGTPVEDAINVHVAAGKPIGGTSAGLAVSGTVRLWLPGRQAGRSRSYVARGSGRSLHQARDRGARFSKRSRAREYSHRQSLRETRPHGPQPGISGADRCRWLVEDAARNRHR